MELEIVYTAAMERERVRAEQRTAPTVKVERKPYTTHPPSDSYRRLVFPLLANGQWWTVRNLSLQLGMDPRMLGKPLLRWVREGLVKREQPIQSAGKPRIPQRYKLVQP